MYSYKSILWFAACGAVAEKVNQMGVMDSPYGVHLVHKVFPSPIKIVEAFHGHDFLGGLGVVANLPSENRP